MISARRRLLPVFLAAGASIAGATAEDSGAPSWTDALTLRSDVRYRLHYTETEGEGAHTEHLLRVRVALGLRIDEALTGGVQVGTGGDDPASSDLRLRDEPAWDDLRLDLAFLSWNPPDHGLALSAGKMEKPFMCISDLIWDRDVNPAGLALRYGRAAGAVEWTAHGARLWIPEADGDAPLFSGQLVGRFHPEASRLQFLAGGGCYLFDDLRGEGLLHANQPWGNSVRAPDTGLGSADPGARPGEAEFAAGFTEIEAFGQVTVDLYYPLRLYGHCVRNAEADTEGDGFLFGVTLGRARAVHSIELDYNFRSLERDAVVGALADRDGFGGTRARGHRIGLGYQAAEEVHLAVRYFFHDLDPKGADIREDRIEAELRIRF